MGSPRLPEVVVACVGLAGFCLIGSLVIGGSLYMFKGAAKSDGVRENVFAARRNAAPIYLEVGEEGTARRSYDINLYKANLTLAEIEAVLLEAAARYALPQERFAAFYSQLRQRPFGHLSGGFARDGSDFLTVYYETQPL